MKELYDMNKNPTKNSRLIKICGIKDIGTAMYVKELGVDLVGLVFADSKRKVDIETAKSICESLGDNVKKVGVFVNEAPERIKYIADLCGLDIIQLHGEENSEDYRYIGKQLIKAIPVSEDDTLETVKIKIDKHEGLVDYILLDTKKKNVFGGLGVAFDWRIVEKLTLEYRNIILAGGLDHSNVDSALKLLDPYGVDVSSGVETNGVKDKHKISEFINKVRSIKGGN